MSQLVRGVTEVTHAGAQAHEAAGVELDLGPHLEFARLVRADTADSNGTIGAVGPFAGPSSLHRVLDAGGDHRPGPTATTPQKTGPSQPPTGVLWQHGDRFLRGDDAVRVWHGQGGEHLGGRNVHRPLPGGFAGCEWRSPVQDGREARSGKSHEEAGPTRGELDYVIHIGAQLGRPSAAAGGVVSQCKGVLAQVWRGGHGPHSDRFSAGPGW